MTLNNEANGINASGRANGAIFKEINLKLIKLQQLLDDLGSQLHGMTSDLRSQLHSMTSSAREVDKITADTEKLSLCSSHDLAKSK